MSKIEVGNTIVFLVGVSKYTDDSELHELPSALDNITELRRIFDKNIGIPNENIHYFVDNQEKTRLLTSIKKEANKNTTKFFIFYYAGHSVLGDNDDLYLTLQNSTLSDIELNGISIAELNLCFRNTTSNVIMIFDSCFSERAFKQINQRNYFIIASSATNETSKYPIGEQFSAFTNELIFILNNGIDNINLEELKLIDIYKEISQRLNTKKLPIPRISNTNNVQDLILLSNNFKKNNSLKLEKTEKHIRIIHPLPPAPHFIGRKKELTELYGHWEANKPALISLIGIGGAGKTAITSDFLNSLLKKGNEFKRKIDYCFVWSFYIDQDINTLVSEAYHYFSNGQNLQYKGSTAIYKLISILEPCKNGLIIFDGLERVQRPFSDSSGQFGELEDHLLKILIRRIAQGIGNVLCIVTSRFVLSDTDIYRQYSFKNIDINYLEEEDAIQLFKYHNINASTIELNDFFKEYGRHALMLDHACIFISEFCYGKLSNFEKFEEPDIESDIREERKLAKILMAYEKVLKKEELDLLIRLCIFRFGISLDNLFTYFLTANTKLVGNLSSLSEITIKKILNRLVKLHLVLNESENFYTTHPAVKDHFYRLFLNINIAHKEASVFYSKLTKKPGVELPIDKKTIDDFEELIYHLISSGAEEAAKDLYVSKLGGFSHLGLCLGEYIRGLRIINYFKTIQFNEDRAFYLFHLGNLQEALKYSEYPEILVAGPPHDTIRFSILSLLGHLNELRQKAYNKFDMSTYHQANLMTGISSKISIGHFANFHSCKVLPILAYHKPIQAIFVLINFLGEYTGFKGKYKDTWEYRYKTISLISRLEKDNTKNIENLNIDKIYENFNVNKIIDYFFKQPYSNNEGFNRTIIGMCNIEILKNKIESLQFKIELITDWIFKSGSQELMCSFYLLRGRFYISQEKFDIAHFDLKEALIIAQNCKLGLYYIEILNQLAILALKQNQIKIAELFALTALNGNANYRTEFKKEQLHYIVSMNMIGAIDKSCGFIYGQIEAYFNLGLINMEKNDFERAEKYLLKCYELQKQVEHYRIHETQLLLHKVRENK